MKNNKGFSLVELIIVIAIMAILVGVMAPQLIKYIEKTNVSNDTQICDTVRTAVQTAMMDPSVITDKNYEDITAATATTYSSIAAVCTQAACQKFTDSINDSLGVPSGTTADAFIKTQMKSSGAKSPAANNCSIEINTTSIIVYIPNTDNSGKKTTGLTLPSTSNSSCIYAGPAETFGF